MATELAGRLAALRLEPEVEARLVDPPTDRLPP